MIVQTDRTSAAQPARHGAGGGRCRWLAALLAPMVAVGLCLAGAAGASAAQDATGDTLVVVGDLVPGPGGSDTNARAVHTIATRQGAAAYVLAGDLQYERGELANYRSRWAPIWGNEFSRSYPAAGNHEYGDGANSGWAATGAATSTTGERGRDPRPPPTTPSTSTCPPAATGTWSC